MANTNDRITLFNGFALDRARGCLVHSGQFVHLRPQSYRVLEYLVQNAGHLISNDTLIDAVWNGRAVTDGAVGKCIEELRVVFGDAGREYLRNVRGRGYIFDHAIQVPANVVRETHSEEIEMLRVVVEDADRAHAPAREKRVFPAARARWKGTTRLAIIATVVIAAVIVVSWLFLNRRHPTTSITSIAVLPLRNESGNSEVDYLSDGLTESLINSLSRLPGLSVKARSTVFGYKGKDLDTRRMAAELSVQAVLTGRFVQRGDDVTLYVSLVDGQTGNQIWGEQYDRKLDQLASLDRQAATDIAQRLNSKLQPTDRNRLAGGSTQNNEAYLTYLKGRYYWNTRGVGYEKSQEFFQKAIDLDPTYGLGYAGLAHYYGFAAGTGMLPPDENWRRSEAAVKKALELDDTRAESYNALAGVQLYYYRDWVAAERSFQRGIDLNPDSAEIQHHYARCLLLFGRNDEALAHMQRALELEPLSVFYNLNAGRLFFSLRQYSKAVDQLTNTLELDPNSPATHEMLGFVYQKMGNQKAAVAEWSKMLSLTGDQELGSTLNTTFDRAGLQAVVRMLAENQLKRLEEKLKRGEYVAAIEYVKAYVRMGDKEKAFIWLQKATQEHNRFAIEFKTDPLYDSLRNDPRFQQLADSVKVNS